MKIQVQGDIPKHIMDEIEKIKPSADPLYWAKPGCKDCAGRGIVGVQTSIIKGNNKITNELLCSCVRKRYRSWVEKTAEKVKSQINDQESEVTELNDGNSKIEEKEKNLRSRLISLEDAISNTRIEIAKEDREINSHSHIKMMEEIEVKRQVADKALQEALKEIEILDKKAIDLLERSRRLLTASKSLAKDAAVVQQEKNDLASTKMAECSATLQTIQAEYRSVEKDFNIQTHKAKRRRRIAENRLDKLLDRRHRIIRESGFDPVSFTESLVLKQES